jgi:glycosyltransferase involved in cell wall biosynthesis
MHFFPRKHEKLISIMLPTRNRAGHLCAAIDSCVSLAKDPSQLEFILKIDDDDIDTIRIAEKLEKLTNVKKIISPRGGGYYDIHKWLIEMTKISSGDWIFFFNDDARIRGQNWDEVVLYIGNAEPWVGMSEACLLYIPTEGRPFAQEFVMIRRGTFDILGNYGLSPHADNWMWSVMNFLGLVLTVPRVTVEHLSDRIGDKTRIESEAAYAHTIDSLISSAAKRKRLQDVDKLLTYMDKLESELVWLDAPSSWGWCWWKPPDGKKMQHVIVDGVGNAAFLKQGVPQKITPVKDLGGKWAMRTL